MSINNLTSNNPNLTNYALVRFNKKNGSIDTTLTYTGFTAAQLKLWALSNTTPSRACVIMDLDRSRIIMEVVGSGNPRSGYPTVHEKESDFEYLIPPAMFAELAAYVAAQ